MNRQLFSLLLVFLLVSPLALAQKNVEKQHLLWTRYLLKARLSENLLIRQEVEERTYWFPWRQHQFVARSLVERKLGKGWFVGAGFTYFLHSLPNNPEIKDYQNKLELRPQLELIHVQSLNPKLSLQHRYWFEWRFFEKDLTGFELLSNRIRYRLELSYSPIKKLTLKAFDEIHLQVGEKIVYNVFDQNRVGGSVVFMPNPDFGFELGYFNWFQQRNTGKDFYSRNITRITLHHTLNLAKK